jgi:uroporphyrinogen decarboxylase
MSLSFLKPLEIWAPKQNCIFAAIHGKKSCISGNYDPVDVLLMGNKKKIAEAVESCARIGGEKYISAAGCEVPRRTPPENLKAVDDTLKNLMMH